MRALSTHWHLRWWWDESNSFRTAPVLCTQRDREMRMAALWMAMVGSHNAAEALGTRKTRAPAKTSGLLVLEWALPCLTRKTKMWVQAEVVGEELRPSMGAFKGPPPTPWGRVRGW